jgi:hydrogenase maturation protein HypF
LPFQESELTSMNDKICTHQIRIFGIVQGVGFRPTVSRYARQFHIAGKVSNRGAWVEIVAQGPASQVTAFEKQIELSPPERADILKIKIKEINGAPRYTSFEIVSSDKVPGDIFVSPDIAICDQCKKELFDPDNRRYLHPFINCTDCGPRFTILDEMPYDRERTSMKAFEMCPDCAEEYITPSSRRYDAQPVCCPNCGPELYLLDRPERGHVAMHLTRKVISEGGIAAIKGIGGFHLCCDAKNEQAVSRLRKLKQRPAKPLAVMMRDEAAVRRECVLGKEEARILTGHQKPIVLLEKKKHTSLCEAISPGQLTVGVMLPYAPVQCLLFDYDDGIAVSDCLVMTSGNARGAAICHNDEEARRELSRFADVILSNDRPIVTRSDDSVMDFITVRHKRQPYMIRRSRGYAPLPCYISKEMKGQLLAVGGELKNTFCIGNGQLFYPSAYVGDLADVRTMKALKEAVERMLTLLKIKPQAVACDLHPGYQSTRYAEALGLPVIHIQHHYAHIVSCMAENDAEGPVIGLAFDGTGYGPDGSIWGGEILIADWQGYERAGHIEPFLQLGGDAASREGWRIAAALLLEHARDAHQYEAAVEKLGLCSVQEARALRMMADRNINAVRSTSAGRLFDAVAAGLGICRSATFEGEAAMALETAAEKYSRDHPEDTETIQGAVVAEENTGLILKTTAFFNHLMAKKTAGEDPGKLASDFHRGLSEMLVAACETLRAKRSMNTVALSGGVFQNKYLTQLTAEKLEKRGFDVLLHRLIPPNDGGIALGQAVAAMSRLCK